MIKNIVLASFSIILSLFLFVQSSAAQDDHMIVDLASDHIDVTVGFSGSTIELFGDRRDKDAQVAIVVEGPERSITIWKKERILGTWINRYYTKFNKIPVYYNYALSHDDFVIKYPDLAKKHRVGVAEMMSTRSIKKSDSIENIEEYRNFLISMRRKIGAFPKANEKIKFLNDHFFRVSFTIPPSVPTGEYKISSILIKDGQVIQARENTLRVKQVGLNAFILKSSKEHAILYAAFCIVLAGLSGWVVSIVRVRI